MKYSVSLAALSAVCSLAAPLREAQNSTSLPVVDLGYQLHRASTYNASGDYYTFSNIRFAAPPTGNLRWRAPQAPAVNRAVIQDGSENGTCIQANGGSSQNIANFIPTYLSGNQTVFYPSEFPPVTPAPFPPAPGVVYTEDCLFLDVASSQKAFEKRQGRGQGAPVLVWIYGGGYTFGSKDQYDPSGLLARSMEDGSDGVIYVAMNYRLGAFGFLAGETLQADGDANAGLLDQRFALDWVQKYIHLFGGDPSRVTIMGESAGGGSVMHQITAYGGSKGPVPFHQAIPQSPAIIPIVSKQEQESIVQSFFKAANVSTLAQARQASTAALSIANSAVQNAEEYSAYAYTPAVDGVFVPQEPDVMMLEGRYDHKVRLIVGHNGDEGLRGVYPFVYNDTGFADQIKIHIPTLDALPNVTNYIVKDLYPAPPNALYKDQIGRMSLWVAEAFYSGHARSMSKALANTASYSYLWNVSTALHGDDIPYTFYKGSGETVPGGPFNSGVIAPQVALAMQRYFTNFAKTCNPNGRNLTQFEPYGPQSRALIFSEESIAMGTDPAANYRTDWWEKGEWI